MQSINSTATGVQSKTIKKNEIFATVLQLKFYYTTNHDDSITNA